MSRLLEISFGPILTCSRTTLTSAYLHISTEEPKTNSAEDDDEAVR